MSITKCNLIRHQCKIVIPKGFYRCKTCKGLGLRFRGVHYRQKFINCYVCPICKGKGYMDWIHNTMEYDFYEELKKDIINYIHNGQYSDYGIHIPLKCPYNPRCKVMRKLIKKHNRDKKLGANRVRQG